MVQHGVFSALNNFIPNNNLIQFVTWRLILRRKIEKQLFHIPIEQWAEISLEVKDHKAHVVLLPGCTIVRDISHQNGDGVDICDSGIISERRGHEADKGESCENADSVRC